MHNKRIIHILNNGHSFPSEPPADLLRVTLLLAAFNIAPKDQDPRDRLWLSVWCSPVRRFRFHFQLPKSYHTIKRQPTRTKPFREGPPISRPQRYRSKTEVPFNRLLPLCARGSRMIGEIGFLVWCVYIRLDFSSFKSDGVIQEIWTSQVIPLLTSRPLSRRNPAAYAPDPEQQSPSPQVVALRQLHCTKCSDLSFDPVDHYE